MDIVIFKILQWKITGIYKDHKYFRHINKDSIKWVYGYEYEGTLQGNVFKGLLGLLGLLGLQGLGY